MKKLSYSNPRMETLNVQCRKIFATSGFTEGVSPEGTHTGDTEALEEDSFFFGEASE